MGQNLFTVLYISVAQARFSQAALTSRLVQSREYNAVHGITGLLVYVNGHWIEFLEGEQANVEESMSRIERDPHHREVEVIEQGPATAREFEDWRMAFLDHASPEVRALPGYSTFLEEPFDWETLEPSGRGVQMLNYFKAIMTASDDSIANLAQKAEIQRRAPAMAGKWAAKKSP
jgi:hypothetical protein